MAEIGCIWARIGPSKSFTDGLRLHSIVFFSSGSGLTADSSVLTLTLAFLDFGLDFAQSFPFHAQFCHFGLGEEVLKIETTVTAKDGTIAKFLGKFPEYKPAKEEEENFKLKAIWENVSYDISDSDSDLESTARSGPRDSEMEDTGSSGMRINA
ncbi:hypothetical protein Tco_0748587 [Tanacetum coccineum]|uniref:Uncharacterized protein n=1 Tax=Tanacetum coccineum TaxID=301880 RepID=A0ABQ4YX69_9ASTR